MSQRVKSSRHLGTISAPLLNIVKNPFAKKLQKHEYYGDVTSAKFTPNILGEGEGKLKFTISNPNQREDQHVTYLRWRGEKRTWRNYFEYLINTKSNEFKLWQEKYRRNNPGTSIRGRDKDDFFQMLNPKNRYNSHSLR